MLMIIVVHSENKETENEPSDEKIVATPQDCKNTDDQRMKWKNAVSKI